jgi:hypothetical protein
VDAAGAYILFAQSSPDFFAQFHQQTLKFFFVTRFFRDGVLVADRLGGKTAVIDLVAAQPRPPVVADNALKDCFFE